MSSKDCGHHGHTKWKKRFRRCCAGLLIFNFILLVTILIVWAILQPSKPRFVLQDVTVFNFNTSVPNVFSSSFQVTIAARNPNDKLGIYYDKLDVYATYRSQQITFSTLIPPVYQGHKDVNIWSPFIYGTEVPIAPYNSIALGQDQNAGSVLFLIKIDGRVRFKVGTFITGRYHLYVRCPAFIPLGSQSTGIVVGNNAVKYQLVQRCSVSV
ncbi:NDR1/HIN1-like protein 1 [Pyrus communis]|uniref:NDR1/HIN1-like protein 1 n=1 Tax=Pyrus communis TaxID=23211 RepID=UPI0035C0CDB7